MCPGTGRLDINKNGSVGRQLFGEVRLDRPELEKDLVELCEMWSDFTNHFRPSKMLIGKTKRVDGKGFKCIYDTPGTPYQRVLDDPDVPEEAKDALIAPATNYIDSAA